MPKNQPDQIRFPKPRPKLINRLGYFLLALSGAYGLITHFLEYEHFAIKWGPFLAIPFGLLGFYLAAQRRSQVLELTRKELIQVKKVLGISVSKKPQSLEEFSRVRLSEDQVEIDGKPKTLYRLFLEGKTAPALLASYSDENEANQRLKAIAKLVELPISWPQV